MKLKGSLYVPIHDFQGNVAVLLPCDTGSLTSYTYTAFGEETIHGGAPNPWRFSSKRTDDKTHLVNFGRRWYLPAHGRWLTPDPEGFIDGMNLYAYVHNSPLTHWDAYGLLDEKGGGWDKMRSWGQSASQLTNYTYSQFVVGFNQAFANDQFDTAHFVNNLAVKPLTNSLGYDGRFSGASVDGWLSKHQENLNSNFFSHADPNSVANKTGGFLGAGASKMLLFGTVAKVVSLGCRSIGKLASGITALRSSIISPAQKLTSGVGSSLSFSVTRSPTSAVSTLQAGKKFKPFTRRNYRDNLKILTGTNPPRNIHAHHVFVQDLEKDFLGKGINVHEPKYLTWWEGSSHSPNSPAYGAEWRRFMKNNPTATQEQILEKGKRMMEKHGIDVNY